MTYFRSVKTGDYFRIDHTSKRVVRLSSRGDWVRTGLRPADMSGFPFIAVKSKTVKC